MESMDRALEDVAGREERGRRCLVMAQDRVRWQDRPSGRAGSQVPGPVCAGSGDALVIDYRSRS